jgi:hypothetical protein
MSAPASTLTDRPRGEVVSAPGLDVATACAIFAAAAQMVTGFAVGHSFRVPRVVRFSTRFVHDPLAALLMGAVAAAATALLVRFALRSRRSVAGFAVCALGSPIAGVLTAFVGVTWMTSLRGGLTLQGATVATKATLLRGLYMIPPGVLWMTGPLVLVLAVMRWRKHAAEVSLERAVWAGALLLVAHAEVAIVVVGVGIWPRLLAGLAVVAAIFCLKWALPAMQRSANPAQSATTTRALVTETALILAAAQVWVGAVWLLWRR